MPLLFPLPLLLLPLPLPLLLLLLPLLVGAKVRVSMCSSPCSRGRGALTGGGSETVVGARVSLTLKSACSHSSLSCHTARPHVAGSWLQCEDQQNTTQ